MPNWCNNYLKVEGDLTKFNAVLGDKSFSIGAFIPTPKELVDTVADGSKHPENVAKYGADNWYDWNVANWGTKWDVDSETKEQSDTVAAFAFDSAWAPPTKAIAAISKLYPDLKFTLEYFEGGMMFCGIATAEAGELDDDCTEDTNSDLWETVAVGSFGYEPWEEEEDGHDDEAAPSDERSIVI